MKTTPSSRIFNKPADEMANVETPCDVIGAETRPVIDENKLFLITSISQQMKAALSRASQLLRNSMNSVPAGELYENLRAAAKQQDKMRTMLDTIICLQEMDSDEEILENIPAPAPREEFPLDNSDDIRTISDVADASILVVEDNLELLSYLEDELSEFCKKVYVAADGVEAFEVLEKNEVDIVISDVMMPRMDGFALCRKIKTTVEMSHIPVILLTARSDENSRIQGYKNGADEYITKPFEMKSLISAVNRMFLRHEIVRQRYSEAIPSPVISDTTFSSADEEFMVKFHNLVNANITDPDLDTRMLVEGMQMSRTVLFTKVKQLTGLNLQNYVNKMRMEHVIMLMRTTDLSLGEIAEKSGFSSPRYFSTSFKNYTGMTPSQYKREKL